VVGRPQHGAECGVRHAVVTHYQLTWADLPLLHLSMIQASAQAQLPHCCNMARAGAGTSYQRLVEGSTPCLTITFTPDAWHLPVQVGAHEQLPWRRRGRQPQPGHRPAAAGSAAERAFEDMQREGFRSRDLGRFQ
jgi:hypothetical protein